jgi:tetratricopeptide (TPR) repeat protein
MISLFGCGAGNWPVEIGRYALGVKISGFCERLFFQRPHNDFIWAACETGIAGFIVYCSIFYKAVKRAINNQSTFILAGLIIYICCAFFSFPRERTFHTIMLLVYLSFLPPGKLCVSKGVFYFSQLIMVIVLLAAICDFTVRYRADEAAKSIRETNSPAEIIEILQISELADIDAYSSPFAWHKGRAYLQIGQIKAAIIEFKKAIKASPYHIGALDNLATALAISGSTESAEEYLQRAIAVRGDCMGMGNKLKIIRQINEMKNENFKE